MKVTFNFTSDRADVLATALKAPPPHDPKDRELVLRLAGWDVRLPAGRFAEYFVPRGFFHLQLWDARTGISILSPSRLTDGFWEVFPVAEWKHRAPTYEAATRALVREHRILVPSAADVLRLEETLVRGIELASKERAS